MGVSLVLLCITVFWSPRSSWAINGVGIHLLNTKHERLEHSIMARNANLRDKLVIIENKLNRIVPFSSCKEVSSRVSGKYVIYRCSHKPTLTVVCEQNAFGGGWIVFQHRFNGKEDFYRNWTDYRDGFGNLDDEFWLGLESLHLLTTARPHELLVELRDFSGNYGYAHYDRFMIGSESKGYSLNLERYSGTAGYFMRANSDMKFSTKVKDNDVYEGFHCAAIYDGAWWYKDCSFTNLNGIYQNTTETQPRERALKGMFWYGLKNEMRAMAFSRMMIREVNGNI